VDFNRVPDHSAFSRARNERFRDSDILRRVFEHVVETCIAAALVGGEGFAVDASLIVADANKQRSIPGAEWNKERAASRAVKEDLATLDEAAFGAASEVRPKLDSPSDPAAQWTGAIRGPAFFAYADNYLVDVKFEVIVDSRGHARHSPSGGRRREDDDWPDPRALRPEARTPCSGHCVRIGGDAQLDRQREEDRSAHSQLLCGDFFNSIDPLRS